jgi:predicted  nucleic acid-binding Zn-ribbon protein
MNKSIQEKLNKFNELKHTVARLEQELAEIKPLMKQEQKDLSSFLIQISRSSFVSDVSTSDFVPPSQAERLNNPAQ